jgi:thiosulfate/3-mercaptopyruvate sulfurtransferase
MKREDILIEADELLPRLNDSKLRIYDATIVFFSKESSQSTYLKGHIPGAAVFDHLQFSDPDAKYQYTVLPEARLGEQIGKIGISAESEVIIYSTTGFPSATRAWWILRYAGHNKMRVLNGGLPAWKKAGGKIEKEPRQYEPATFKTHLRPGMFADKEEVLASIQDQSVRIEYALPLEAYGGSHIPGSYANSCLDIMQGMDALLSDEVIIPHMQKGMEGKRVITYCGGGIAATINAVALLIAGHEDVAIYSGSLVEWTGEGMPTAKENISLMGRVKMFIMFMTMMIRARLFSR